MLLTPVLPVPQEYWASHHNSRLRFPEVFGIKIRSGAIFPAEVCTITPGQRYKKRLSPDDTASFLKFSVSKPQDRLRQVEGAVTKNVRTRILTGIQPTSRVIDCCRTVAELCGFTLDDRVRDEGGRTGADGPRTCAAHPARHLWRFYYRTPFEMPPRIL